MSSHPIPPDGPWSIPAFPIKTEAPAEKSPEAKADRVAREVKQRVIQAAKPADIPETIQV